MSNLPHAPAPNPLDLEAVLVRLSTALDQLESNGKSEWMTLREAAEYARYVGADGDATDKFYGTIKRALGKRSRVSREEVDDLIRRGVL